MAQKHLTDKALRNRELQMLRYCDTRARELMTELGKLEVQFPDDCEIQDTIRLNIASVAWHFARKWGAVDKDYKTLFERVE